MLKREDERKVSTHSRPKAAAFRPLKARRCRACFNTQPPEGGCTPSQLNEANLRRFQHTAARRRLLESLNVAENWILRFNTQPPEGGCPLYKKMIKISKLFTVFRYPLKYKEYQEV